SARYPQPTTPPPQRGEGVVRTGERSGLVATGIRRLAGVAGGPVTLGRLGGLRAEVTVRRRLVAGRITRGRDRLVGAGRGAGHGVLPVGGNGAVAGRCRRPGVLLLSALEHRHTRGAAEGDGQPRPAPALLLDAQL